MWVQTTYESVIYQYIMNAFNILNLFSFLIYYKAYTIDSGTEKFDLIIIFIRI